MQSKPAAQARTILVVDDNIDTRLLTKMFLNHCGYEVDSAGSADEALKLFNPLVHELVITDNSMPGLSGLEMSRLIKQKAPLTPVLMCTGNPPVDEPSIDVVIPKPTHLLAIKDAVDRLLVKK